ncbi:MAG: hypothetical protein ACI8TQ_003857 [Planctomycetota bacterium]|jgi:hypothetical protein
MDNLRMDRRAALGLAVGVSLGARSWWTEAQTPSDDEIVLWVADRDAQAVIGLNRGLLHRVCVPVAHPIAIASASNGGIWVVSALKASRSAGNFEWLRLDVDGQLLARGEMHDFLSMRATLDGGVWLLSQKGRKLQYLSGTGGEEIQNGKHVGGALANGVGVTAVYQPVVQTLDWNSCSFDCAQAMAVNREGELLVNGDDDGFELIEDGVQVDCPLVIESALDICSVGGDWWILTERLLLHITAEMDLAGLYDISKAGTKLIGSEVHQGVWLLDGKGVSAELFSSRRRSRWVIEWEQSGACDGIELERGALLIATPGALIVLDENGHARAGQGGFREIVGVALAIRGQPRVEARD